MRCNALVLILAGAVVLAGVGTAAAAYPDRPIQIVIPYSPGGSTDLLPRTTGKVAPSTSQSPGWW